MKKAVAMFIIFAAVQIAQGASEIYKTKLGGLAIKGYDPVAYFIDKKPVKGEKAHTFKWKEAHWRFASVKNLELFKADPEKYAPQYGGYCAYAVSQGNTASIDPDQWTVLAGKLYLNYNKKINLKWRANRDEFIKLADEKWPGVLK